MRAPYGPRIRPLVEGFIILSVAATLFGEAAIVAGAPWAVRAAVGILNLALDLGFFLEFAILLGQALAEGRLGDYLKSEGGWIDLLAAVLPLTFTSGPFLFGGAGTLVSTTAVSALGSFRLLRGLGLMRLLRLLRLFPTARRGEAGQSPTEAPAALGPDRRRRAATFSLLAVLGVLVAAEGASVLGAWPDAHGALSVRREATLAALEARPGADAAEAVAGTDLDLLLVRSGGTVVFTRYSAEEYHRRFGPDEIGYLRGRSGVDAFFSLRGELRAEAATTFASGLCGLAVLLALLVSRAGGRYRRADAEGETPLS